MTRAVSAPELAVDQPTFGPRFACIWPVLGMPTEIESGNDAHLKHRVDRLGASRRAAGRGDFPVCRQGACVELPK
jgi:hypothetical protein